MKLYSPQIISKEIFIEVKNKIKSTKRSIPHKYFYVLEGKLKCGICGLTYFPHKRESNKDNAYKCLSRRYKQKCNNYGISIPKVNGSIWTLLRSNQSELENIITINQNKEKFLSDINLLKDSKKISINELNQLKRKEQKLLELFLNDGISNDLIKQNLNELYLNINKINREILLIENEIIEKRNLLKKQQNASISLRSIKDDKHILKSTFNKVIDKINIFPIYKISSNKIFENKQDKLIYIELYTYLSTNKPISCVISQRTQNIMFIDDYVNFDKDTYSLVIEDCINTGGEEEEYEPLYRTIIELESLKS